MNSFRISISIFLIIAFPFIGMSQDLPECYYSLHFGQQTIKLCDQYDTVPRRDSLGKIIGDTVFYRAVSNLRAFIPIQQVVSAREIRVTKLEQQGTAIDVGKFKMTIQSGGHVSIHKLAEGRIDEKLHEALEQIYIGDLVKITGTIYNHEMKPLHFGISFIPR